jgi:hypothetical protein
MMGKGCPFRLWNAVLMFINYSTVVHTVMG